MCTVGPSAGTISPVHRPLLLCAFRKKYWKCLLLSTFIYICLAASLSCWFHNSSNSNSGCTRTHSFIPMSLFMMFYVIYLIECWRNSPLLMPFVSREYVQQHINLVRHAAPVIWWRVVCYHFVRRSRQIVRYRSGVANTTTQVYYERTNSHVDEQEFEYSNCGVRDVSSDIINLGKHSLVVINFSKCFSFANLACENQYLGQRCDFFRSNETWDNYLEAKEGMKLRNVEWKDQIIVCGDPLNPPMIASHHVYWIFSIFLSSWFIRVFLDHKAAIVNYQVEKLFGDVQPATNGEQASWGPLARVATMDSTELEWQIQTNQLRVPTYGEATRDTTERYHENVPPQTNENIDNIESNNYLQLRRKHLTQACDMPSTSMHRTSSWIRDGRRRSIVTSLRRSVSQLFGRPITESDDDDITLLSNSPQHTEHRTGRPISEAPPTYSEAMELHRILGFYDTSNRFNNAEFDVVRSEYNLNRSSLDSSTSGTSRGASSSQRGATHRKYYRRKRPSQLRVRSQYGATPTSGSPSTRRSIIPRDVITGPAAISGSRNSNPVVLEFPATNNFMEQNPVDIVKSSENNTVNYRQTNFIEPVRQNRTPSTTMVADNRSIVLNSNNGAVDLRSITSPTNYGSIGGTNR